MTRTTLRSGLFALLLLPAAVSGVRAQADTARAPLFTWKDAAILELFVIATVATAPVDRKLADRIQRRSVQENRAMRRTAVAVETITDPGSFLIGAGLYTYGRLRNNHRAADLGLHGTEALFIGAQMGLLLKGIVGRARPYVNIQQPHDYRLFRGFQGKQYQSFPSGHTIAAFSAASAVTFETRRWWPKSVWFIGPVMYGGAALVGWSRMYDNKHWASDVITGAAIGAFVGQKVVQWHHTHPGNAVDRIFLGATATPQADGSSLLRLHFATPF